MRLSNIPGSAIDGIQTRLSVGLGPRGERSRHYGVGTSLSRHDQTDSKGPPRKFCCSGTSGLPCPLIARINHCNVGDICGLLSIERVGRCLAERRPPRKPAKPTQKNNDRSIITMQKEYIDGVLVFLGLGIKAYWKPFLMNTECNDTVGKRIAK